jgi:hypothetical protein
MYSTGNRRSLRRAINGFLARWRFGLKLEPMDLLQFGFDGLLAFPSHRTEAGMKMGLVKCKNEVALAHGWTIETIGAVEADVHCFRVALKFVTGQAVDLQALRVIQTFLA